MKATDKKLEFIRLRANKMSYAKIAEQLHISKSTCSAWAEELEAEVAELEGERLQELYTQYGMEKAERINQLGESLHQINTALDEADLSQVPPEKLLDFKLKYMDALKGEYIRIGKAYQLTKESVEAKDIVQAYGDLLARVQTGEVSTEQANRESAVLANLLKAYELVEVKAKLDALETILEGR